MTLRPHPLALAAACALAHSPLRAQTAPEAPRPPVQVITITAPAPLGEKDHLPQAQAVDAATLARRRLGSSDAAALLDGQPGVSLNGAGGVSALPAVHGLADDRLRVQVDGMDLMAACPNHMNSPLSYIDASAVGQVIVYAGITPVSVGGDSLGGTVQVESAAPLFAAEPGTWVHQGELGGAYRSNGNAWSADANVTLATDTLSLRYTGASTRSDNYRAAWAFKDPASGSGAGSNLPADEVGSSAYRAHNQALSLALRQDNHLLQLSASYQDIPFEGYPNQRMDMTSNRSTQLNARYRGQYDWGELQAQAYSQRTDHRMDMGPDRDTYGTGMPMDTAGRTLGASVQASLMTTPDELIRLGAEYQRYRLNDWWPPVGGTMGPNTFWNLNLGQRDKVDVYAEQEQRWSPQWSHQIGLRLSRVHTAAGAVQGYNDALSSLWGADAAAFNAADRERSDLNADLTALARYRPDGQALYEFGYARKSRAPNLYQRYAWSTQGMAALMNNFVGDGNGYIGDPDLKPEVAHTLSLSGQWQAGVPTEGVPADPAWSLRANAYLTRIEHYIDAQRCGFGQCGSGNLSATDSFVLLQYANQRAQLRGLDLSGQARLWDDAAWGRWGISGVLNWVHGRNLQTHDGLYNVMPLNLRLGLSHTLGGWQQTLEWQVVRAKTNVSAVRNEIPTPAYALLNWHASWQMDDRLRLELGVDNLLDRRYRQPTGGAYLGQGSSMALTGIPWGVAVPGKARSFLVGARVAF
ncbi:TonB-dependent receptor [Ideonella oryzae]|uniref:TonB-dependent receptor n=1 Tax=Ideonella oryzae TaxID=2937441 RepID=A0ABT1BSX3_9BURK|nr:TonB-dependent receptor [Ideonella oryzae]MCO5979326.1 TonB-dependent receptor [Ideonella oryzae]